ncbi:MAG: ester cyclase [Gemmatimonadota bacterium]|jgi:steroid delta-isomerase-like uncharacterized protein
MGTAERQALVYRIADEIWNAGDLSVVDEVMAPGAPYHGPHMPDGAGDRESWRHAIATYRAAFPDSHVTFEELIDAEHTVIGRWRATGTHTGHLPGMEPTGQAISLSGITIYRFADGRIVEAWEELDLLGMWQQLGAVALPGED